MECAHIVRAHAERWHKSQWLNARGSYAGKGKTVATLSPRIGTVAGREEWVALERDRRDAIDSLRTTLDERYIGALGEPSYWSLNRTKATPEIQQKFGASLWEMTPRNRGNEFVTMRLLKLASIITARTAEKVHSGLFGLKMCIRDSYISRAIEVGHPIFSKMPQVRVRYEMIPGDESSVRYFDDVQLPHRAVDAHIRIAERCV